MNVPSLSRPKFFRVFLVVSFLIILFIVAELTGLRDKITITYIKDLFIRHKLIGSVLFVCLFALGNLLYIPSWIFLVGGVLAVGKWYACPLAFIGGMLSSVLSYFIVGFVGKDTLRVLEKYKYVKRFFEHLDDRPIRTIILLRVLFQTAPFLNYALILSNVRFRDFWWGTFFGLPIPIIFLCLVFDFVFKNFLN